MEIGVELDSISVYPSAAACATTSPPTLPPAPGRLSITIACPSFGGQWPPREPGHDVAAAPRRKGHHDLDRPFGPGGERGERHARGGGAGRLQQVPAGEGQGH